MVRLLQCLIIYDGFMCILCGFMCIYVVLWALYVVLCVLYMVLCALYVVYVYWARMSIQLLMLNVLLTWKMRKQRHYRSSHLLWYDWLDGFFRFTMNDWPSIQAHFIVNKGVVSRNAKRTTMNGSLKCHTIKPSSTCNDVLNTGKARECHMHII